jgi:hypothetical protein
METLDVSMKNATCSPAGVSQDDGTKEMTFEQEEQFQIDKIEEVLNKSKKATACSRKGKRKRGANIVLNEEEDKDKESTLINQSTKHSPNQQMKLFVLVSEFRCNILLDAYSITFGSDRENAEKGLSPKFHETTLAT